MLLAGLGDLFDGGGRRARGARAPRSAAARSPTTPRSATRSPTQRPDVVCLVAPSDELPLRLALLVRHLDEDVPIVATIFDRVARRPARATRSRTSTSPRWPTIAAPSLAGPCIEDGLAGVLPGGDGVARRRSATTSAGARSHPPASRWARALLTAIFKPYDRSAALLFYGAIGPRAACSSLETVGAMIVLDQGFPDALYGSTKSLATVGPNTAVQKGPGWFKLAMVATMLLTLLSAACFTGGLIDRLTSTPADGPGRPQRGAAPRPRRGGRPRPGRATASAPLLRECGIPVVVVEADEDDESVGHARRDKLPVVIGRGADPVVLRRLSLDRARALAAVTPDDLTNVEVAMTARSLADDLRVVLRAGDGEVAQETGSLFRIGHVIDVHRVAAALIAARALGGDEQAVVAVDGEAKLLPSA